MQSQNCAWSLSEQAWLCGSHPALFSQELLLALVDQEAAMES